MSESTVPDNELTADRLRLLKVPQLKTELIARGLSIKGVKEKLIEILVEYAKSLPAVSAPAAVSEPAVPAVSAVSVSTDQSITTEPSTQTQSESITNSESINNNNKPDPVSPIVIESISAPVLISESITAAATVSAPVQPIIEPIPVNTNNNATISSNKPSIIIPSTAVDVDSAISSKSPEQQPSASASESVESSTTPTAATTPFGQSLASVLASKLAKERIKHELIKRTEALKAEYAANTKSTAAVTVSVSSAATTVNSSQSVSPSNSTIINTNPVPKRIIKLCRKEPEPDTDSTDNRIGTATELGAEESSNKRPKFMIIRPDQQLAGNNNINTVDSTISIIQSNLSLANSLIPTNSIRIDGFTRPILTNQIESLIQQFGTIEQLYIPPFKEYSLIQYSTVIEAQSAFASIHLIKFPTPERTPLTVQYIKSATVTEALAAVKLPVTAVPTESDQSKSIPALNQLFRVTITQPPLYWLPRSEADIAEAEKTATTTTTTTTTVAAAVSGRDRDRRRSRSRSRDRDRDRARGRDYRPKDSRGRRSRSRSRSPRRSRSRSRSPIRDRSRNRVHDRDSDRVRDRDRDIHRDRDRSHHIPIRSRSRSPSPAPAPAPAPVSDSWAEFQNRKRSKPQ